MNYYTPTFDVSGGRWTGPSIDLPTLEVVSKPAEHVPMTLQLPTLQLGHKGKGYSSTPLVFEPGSFMPATTQLRYRPGEITLPHHQPLNIRRCVEGLICSSELFRTTDVRRSFPTTQGQRDASDAWLRRNAHTLRK